MIEEKITLNERKIKSRSFQYKFIMYIILTILLIVPISNCKQTR